ncbi:MAG: nucleotidyltransferase family protein [Phycisphaerae bacterium]|jgi:molybdenum cofactor cytidylyltransferase
MTDTKGNPIIWAIIPAAGLGRRMGRAKQALHYRGSTFAAVVTRTLLDAGVETVVVVTRAELAESLRLPDDPRVTLAFNDDTDTEMIDSIRIGLAALDHVGAASDDGVLVAPADMPTISCPTYHACSQAFRDNPGHIVIARHNGKRGHPIIFPFALRRIVDTLDDGLRNLPIACKADVHYVDVDDPGATNDVNTPGDYARLNPPDSLDIQEP